MERIQKDFRHDIREIKEEIARLAKLVESNARVKVGYIQESSPFLIQPLPYFFLHPSPRPYILIVNNKAYCPNL